ncbi:MAG: rhomboid family intramembrane serine protease [Candidatus Lokiarchaeota archaeon]|nr:rhomboid family intramembrane serine protease [Candidatus Lokiarchaeota archaeon]
MVLEATDDKISFFKQYFSVIILVANIAVFVWQMMDPTGQMHLEYAFVPTEFFAGEKLWTIFTSMFMHGDIIHIIMNMWFFFVITDNCEHAMGHLFYVITYFVSGIFATMLHAFSTILIPVWGPILAIIPSLGASGAIFGLMAVYLMLYPSNKFYLPTGSTMRKVTASYFIITYFIAELTYAMVSLYSPFGDQTAHFAHVGGFVAGAIMAGLFKAVKGSSYEKKPK